MKFLVLIVAVFISLTTWAGWNEDFAELKKIPRDYQDAGSICEEVARLDMQKVYPAPQFSVEVGIAYGNEERTLGELDVIIFDNNTNNVYKIGEVKCWKDVRGGLKKAREQRSRFLSAIRGNAPLFFRSTSTGQLYDQSKFQTVTDFFSISQKGSTREGFDIELKYTLAELKQYRKDMIRCQTRKECATP